MKRFDLAACSDTECDAHLFEFPDGEAVMYVDAIAHGEEQLRVGDAAGFKRGMEKADELLVHFKELTKHLNGQFLVDHEKFYAAGVYQVLYEELQEWEKIRAEIATKGKRKISENDVCTIPEKE